MALTTHLIDHLRSRLGEDAVLTGDAVRSRLAGVGRVDTLQATVLARPRDTAGVAEVMRCCHQVGQPVVVHGGLTGLVHGADTVAGDLVLSTERMTAIEDVSVSERSVTAQAGATIEAVQQAARAAGLDYPVDYGSRSSATLGGGIATNAGGNRVLQAGMTRASVLGLEVVLADGTILSSMGSMLKNNSGYDLKQLFIGSEGTLGIVTRAVMRLKPAPRSLHTALIGCRRVLDLEPLLRKVEGALGGQLAAFEVMWADFFRLTSQALAGAASGNPGRRLFADEHDCYALIEASGADTQADAERFDELLQQVLDEGLGADVLVARSLGQRQDFWRIRDNVEAMRPFGPRYFDVSLPIAQMPAYVETVQASVRERWPQGHCWVFGHMGDGNLHVSIATGELSGASPTDHPVAVDVHAIESVVYEPLRPFRGAISAEHGIGLEKKAWLPVSRSAEEIALMALLKRTLDPRGLLNRGKVIDG